MTSEEAIEILAQATKVCGEAGMTSEEAIETLTQATKVCGEAVDLVIPGFLDAMRMAIDLLRKEE